MIRQRACVSHHKIVDRLVPQVWREGLTTVLRLQRIPLVQYRAINYSLAMSFCSFALLLPEADKQRACSRIEAGHPRARWQHQLPPLPAALRAGYLRVGTPAIVHHCPGYVGTKCNKIAVG